MDKNQIISKLNKLAPDSVLEERRFGRSDTASIWVEAESILKVAHLLKSESDLKMDWLENLSIVEFEDVLVATYFVTSSTSNRKIILRISGVPISLVERVEFLSTRSIWPMAAPMEKEAEDLFGIKFIKDSADISNFELGLQIRLLPENWEGFPLRKGYVFPKKVYGIEHSRSEKSGLGKKANLK